MRALLFLLAGCGTAAEPQVKAADTASVSDADGDGFSTEEGDCDDSAPLTNPGVDEACNGIDDDCDGEVDEGVMTTWHQDADGDGFGNPWATDTRCEPADETWVADDSDCDDTRDTIHPGAEEGCDEADNDCDGEVDEDGGATFWADADGDGYGDPAVEISACAAEEGFVSDATDCDDADAAIHPGAEETCNELDDDCDGEVDEGVGSTWYEDADGDGWGGETTATACEAPVGYVAPDGDCDDADPAFNPGASEACDDPTDYNCDGSVGYADADADGWAACVECDDTAFDVNPAATEVCNGIDDDCDGAVDDDDTSLDTTTGSDWYADADADGYGAGTAAAACVAPAGTVASSDDCDDAAAAVNPGATEVCNDLDDDCDGAVDDDDASLDTSTASAWYADGDGDGYGAGSASLTCDAPAGSVASDQDCDDADAAVNPAAVEVCNGLDDDCDGDTDDDDASLDTTSATKWYDDDDGDGYGAGSATRACVGASGQVANNTDCDDTDDTVSPSGTETCDGVDEDCDGSTDEGLLGSGSACVAESCLEILTDGSSTGDGTYWIDFSGTPTETTCDMTTDGGGWTLLFSDDFESAPDARWSASATYACGTWSTILGGYGNIAGGTMSIDLDTEGVTHTYAWAELTYAALDSWDGETMYVQIDGTTVWSQAQNNHSTSYSEVCGWNRGYYGSYDSEWEVSETAANTGPTVTLLAGSTLDQGPTDESFGIDDVFVWLR